MSALAPKSGSFVCQNLRFANELQRSSQGWSASQFSGWDGPSWVWEQSTQRFGTYQQHRDAVPICQHW